MEPKFYDSERAMRLDQLKQYGRLTPARKAEIEEQLRRMKAAPKQYQVPYKISTLEILLEVRG